MKKIVRLTESDLTRIVRRMINEELTDTSSKINYSAVGKFLRSINQVGNRFRSNWILDPNNPKKRTGSLKLTGREETIPMNYVGKPLVWSLVVNGKKDPNSIFQIFLANGKIYYQCYSSAIGHENTVGYETLEPNLSSAIEQFNQRVSLQ